MTHSIITATARLRWLETGDGHDDNPITAVLIRLIELELLTVETELKLLCVDFA